MAITINASIESTLYYFRIFLLSLIAVLSHLASPYANAAQYMAGDVAPRGAPDGELNVADILVLTNIYLDETDPCVLDASSLECRLGDVAPLNSPDGAINLGDIVVLQRAVFGLISLPPIWVGIDGPSLNSLPATTSLNPLTVSGTAEPNSEVRLYINGSLQRTVVSDASGNFSFSAALLDGTNTIYATTWDGTEESLPSNDPPVSVVYENTIPRNQSGTISANTVWTADGPGGANDVQVSYFPDTRDLRA